jgi:hypothetical protein
VLAAAAGVGKRTVSRLIRWLKEAGWLSLLEPGSTPQFRPHDHPLKNDPENLAADYQLLVDGQAPAPAISAPITEINHQEDDVENPQVIEGNVAPSLVFGSFSLEKELSFQRRNDHDFFGDNKKKDHKRSPLRGRSEDKGDQQWLDFEHVAPASKAQMLVAASQLRPQHSATRRLTPRALRSLCKRFYDAGWTNHDIAWAIDHRPGGQFLLQQGVYAIIQPYGWLRGRLRAWINPETGAPVMPKTTQDQHKQHQINRYGRGITPLLVPGQEVTAEVITAYALTRVKAATAAHRSTMINRKIAEREAAEQANPMHRKELPADDPVRLAAARARAAVAACIAEL